MPSVKRAVYQAIEWVGKIDKEDIYDAGELEGYGLDSLDIMEIVMHIESNLHIQISDDQVDHMKTVGDILNIVGGIVEGQKETLH